MARVGATAACRSLAAFFPALAACLAAAGCSSATAIGPCVGETCSGHGECVVEGGEAVCRCDPGYRSEGLSCLVNPDDPCSGVDCSGHGECVVEGDLPRCECEAGYRAEGLECVPLGADGDSDVDEDGDVAPLCPGESLSEGMVLVPEGPFWMGCNEAPTRPCPSFEVPYHEVFLDAYEVQVTEVTVVAYRACVEAGACEPAPTGEECNWGVPGRDHHPVSCVSWEMADAYCRWSGLRLCTEAEWEKAARGTDGRLYPWGDERPTCERAVIAEEHVGGCGAGSTLPVGSRPGDCSPYGALDMLGNVREYASDRYDEGYFSVSPYRNPTGPDEDTGVRSLRGGGSWAEDADMAEMFGGVAYRLGLPPGTTGGRDWGLRCCRSL